MAAVTAANFFGEANIGQVDEDVGGRVDSFDNLSPSWMTACPVKLPSELNTFFTSAPIVNN